MILRHKVKSHKVPMPQKNCSYYAKLSGTQISTTAKERAVAETVLLLAGQKQSMKKISPLV